MPTLTIAERHGERIKYEPVLLEISGFSDYNANQVRFTGIDGFWMWTEWAAKEADRNDPPPKDTIAWFGLATNPKRDARAKPGALYMDIYSVQRASQEDKDSFDPAVRWQTVGGGQQDAPAGGTGPQTGIDERIAVGMAFNNLTHMLATPNDFFGENDAGHYRWVDMKDLWNKWFDEASRGLPLTPVSDEPTVEAQPEDTYQNVPAVEDDVQELPW